jgi:alkylation response protein AidB-like acyl-CoA dehydrogenase
MNTTAKKVGDKYVLNGRKCFITNGGVADVFTVFATLDPAKGHKGICAFVVAADTPGVSAGKKEDKMGQRASNTTDVLFEDAAVPAENLLGREGEGFKIAMKTLDRTRPAIGALAVGLARSAYEHAVRYARERNAFGMPIAMFQAIQFMIADMAKDIEASRLLTYQAAWMIDQGMNRRSSPLREVLRDGRGDARHDGCRPDFRRLRVLEGIPGGEADARRQAPPDLRGHQPDPADGHGPRDLQGIAVTLPPAASRRHPRGRTIQRRGPAAAHRRRQ